ncbi:hypothetical protein Anas_14141 [Armadillidium nasatum]|uniref:Uncharacterized protein n=1 Tax=Armadillidium nasatum TaxID=96803 RepID=A0A5N5TIJ8_9CRUS|nr:hypothetical protein Anas_14141 [Armadillidium nasatum]
MSVVCVVGERKGAFLWWWIPVLGSHSSAWITLQCSDSIPVLGSLSSAWLVSSARIRIHSVSVSSTRISFSAVFNPEEDKESFATSAHVAVRAYVGECSFENQCDKKRKLEALDDIIKEAEYEKELVKREKQNK